MSWQEELKQNITTAKELSGLLNCTPEEQQGFAEILEQYPMSITPYYLSLINFEDEHDPISSCNWQLITAASGSRRSPP